VPEPGHWEEALNSDAPLYGGTGQARATSRRQGRHPGRRPGHYYSLNLTLPPLGVLLFRLRGD